MQKLKLNIEELDVVSFEMADDAPAVGTVAAHQEQGEVPVDTEVSACTCTTNGTWAFSAGCEQETYPTYEVRFC